VRIVLKILQNYVPHRAMPFLDNIGVKGPKSRYNDKKVPDLPKVRRFVIKHIQNLDTVLADLERAEATMSAKKSKFCMAGLKIVRYAYDADGRHPNSLKILKILNWRKCDNVTEAKAFIEIYGYYRI
jgi:hypothetical protein